MLPGSVRTPGNGRYSHASDTGDVARVELGVPTLAEVALERTQAIVARLPDVERSDNPLGCYFLVRRRIFAQVATVTGTRSQSATIVALKPNPDEREALIAIGHPYFSRGPWDNRLGRIAVRIETSTDWDEIAELVTDSYRLTAPKKLVAHLDTNSTSARAPPRLTRSPGSLSPTAGQFITKTFEYDGGRQVTVYVPPAPAEAVVFAGDGGWHISRLGAALEAARLSSTMVVGVHGLPDDDGRLKEYVAGLDESTFAAHEHFFVEDVRGWVRTRFGAPLSHERTAVWGASLGGELALAIGLRHPASYGAVFSASPGGGYKPPAEMPSSLPRVYIVAGTQEPFFLKNATRWAAALRSAGADVVLTERAGPHGGEFWGAEFPLMVAWAFGH